MLRFKIKEKTRHKPLAANVYYEARCGLELLGLHIRFVKSAGDVGILVLSKRQVGLHMYAASPCAVFLRTAKLMIARADFMQSLETRHRLVCQTLHDARSPQSATSGISMQTVLFSEAKLGPACPYSCRRLMNNQPFESCASTAEA